eukprot:5899565-Alexandrium_andersonii.AAC.1
MASKLMQAVLRRIKPEGVRPMIKLYPCGSAQGRGGHCRVPRPDLLCSALMLVLFACTTNCFQPFYSVQSSIELA